MASLPAWFSMHRDCPTPPPPLETIQYTSARVALSFPSHTYTLVPYIFNVWNATVDCPPKQSWRFEHDITSEKQERKVWFPSMYDSSTYEWDGRRGGGRDERGNVWSYESEKTQFNSLFPRMPMPISRISLRERQQAARVCCHCPLARCYNYDWAKGRWEGTAQKLLVVIIAHPAADGGFGNALICAMVR